MLITEIEWQIPILSTVAHGNGQRNSSSIGLTCPFGITTSFFPHWGKKISHSDFQNTLLGKLLAHAGHEWNVQRPIGRSPAAATQVVRFEERGRKRWPISSSTRRRFRVCAERVSPETFQ